MLFLKMSVFFVLAVDAVVAGAGAGVAAFKSLSHVSHIAIAVLAKALHDITY